MIGMGERLFALLLRLYPRSFRDEYRADLIAFFRQDRDHPKHGSGMLRPVRFWTATVRDLLATALNQRRSMRRDATPSRAGAASTVSRWQRDVRVAWRGLWSAPGVTLPALVVLTIGIGASTSIFSVVDAVVLRGLPYPDDGRLVSIRETDRQSGSPLPATPQTYLAWARRQRAFARIGASTNVRLTTIDSPIETVLATRMTASMMDLLQVAPALGRTLQEADEHPGARSAAILSDRLWRSRFGADPNVIGRTIAFKTGVVEIVGVMPVGFRYPVSTTADLWMPLVFTPDQTVRGKSHAYFLTVVGRLGEDVPLSTAAMEMERLQALLAVEDPGWFKGSGVQVRLLRDWIIGAPVRSWMMLLLAAVAGVLLIACLNVANLLVARAVARGPELAVRTALGASRWDLSRALVIESLMLSLLGTAGGVLASLWGVEILRASLPANIPRLATVAVDLRVIAVAATTAIATGVAFGTLPALQASRPDLIALAGQSGRTHAGGRAGRRLRTSLVIGEVAVASVLLVGSGMFLSSFVRVTSIDMGFDPKHVIALTGGVVNTALLGVPDTPDEQTAAASGQALLMSAIDHLRTVPGVVAAGALGGGRPLGGSGMTLSVQLADRSSAPFVGDDEAHVRCVTSGYLDVLRGTLVRGRWIEDTDVSGRELVVVLSDEAARRYFGSRDPIGQRLLLERDRDPRTIVGTVRAMRFGGPEASVTPEIFVPLRQTAYATAELMARTDPDPTALVPSMHAAIRSVMPAAQVQTFSLEGDYASLLAQRKFNMIVLVLFGVVAVVVAAAGVYGLMAVLVQQRRREIGVRVALGADPAGILRMVLARAASLMIVGLLAGGAAAALVERLARPFLFEPQAYDPIVYAGAAAALFAAGLAAAFGPARRAARLDPLVALRAD